MNVLTSETIEFLNHLHRGGVYAYYWTVDQAEKYTDKNGNERECKSTYWFKSGKPTRLPRKETLHVYFGVNPTNVAGGKFQRVQVSTVSAINCLFAEFDAKLFASGMPDVLAHVQHLDPAPSIIIKSGGGYHTYWLLDEPYKLDDSNRRKVINLLYGWVDRVGGDPDAKDLARVLRVPGTRNIKPEYAPDFPMVEFVKRDMACLYSIDELAALVPVAEPRPARAKVVYDASQLNERRVRAYVNAAVTNIVTQVESALDGQKHFTLRSAACGMGRLVGAGWISEDEAETLLVDAISERAKDMGNALSTIRSGIALGMENPAQMCEREVPLARKFDPYAIVKSNKASDPYTIVRAKSARLGS